MSIEEAIKQLTTYSIPCGKYKNAYDMAIETMRKYQKIVSIVSLNDEEFKQCGLKELKEILEVIAEREG